MNPAIRPDTSAKPPAMLDHQTLSDDAFLGGALKLYQPKTGYRAGIDAVLLAATVPHGPDKNTCQMRVLDVGAGVGTVGMCVAHRVKRARVTLVEQDEDLVAIALENRARNNLDSRIEVANVDIRAPSLKIGAGGPLNPPYDYVLANPPFHTVGRGTPASSHLKSRAHAMPDAELDRWLRFMTRMTAPNGIATLIHKAQALDRLLEAMHGRFGAIRILPLHARPDTSANRVIVTGIKGSKAELKIYPGLILHTPGHRFTTNIDAILRDGDGLDILW